MESFKTVNGVPTKIISFGKGIDDDLTMVEHLVLIFPGNPGVIEFYREFMEEMYNGLKEKYPNHNPPVWGISHAGHQVDHLDSSAFPNLHENRDLYSLDGQCEHKVKFIESYIPSHVKVIGVGHSIGCKTWSETVKRIEIKKSSPSQISKCFMLFPTLEKMRVTPNGKRFTFFMNYHSIIESFLRLILMLPTFIHSFLLRLYFKGQTVPNYVKNGTLQLFNISVCKRVLYMARCEMTDVYDLDVTTLENHIKKFFFYFGTTDGWVPLEFAHEMKNKLPGMDYKICDKGYQHAFVIKSSSEMATEMCSLINLPI